MRNQLPTATSLDPAIARCCLVLMLKAPARSKRRLAADIGVAAGDVARRLTDCALEDMQEWRGGRCYAPAAAEDAAWLRNLAVADGDCQTQRGVNLGARINHLDRALRQRGWRRQLYIGTDCPQLDLAYLERAAAALSRHDAVFGPAHDGGVVLLGARRPWPDLRGLPWSTAELYRGLNTLCRDSGWSCAELDALPDVDRAADLDPLIAPLERDPRPARRALRAWLLAHPAERC